MAGFFDALQSLLQDSPTDVSGVEVNPARQSGLGGLVSPNSPVPVEAQRTMDFLTQPQPRQMAQANDSGYKNPRGTLARVLGTLGDAFLMRDGDDPIYGPQVDRERVAHAMQGFENDPLGAAGRVSQVATPGSAEQAQKMFDSYQTQELRKTNQQNTQDYRDSQTENRKATQLRQYLPAVGAMLNDPRIKTKEQYKAQLTRALQVLKRVDPNITAQDIGALEAEEWEPAGIGSTLGMTRNQVIQDENADANRAQSGALGRERIATTQRGQDIASGDRAAGRAATQGRYDTTRSDKADKAGKGKSAAKAALKPAPKAAIDFLKKNPKMKADFDAKYGKGAAKAYGGI